MASDDVLTVGDRPAPRTSPKQVSPGQTVGRFVLVAELGTGGMGVVFRARDPQLGREVAIKLLRDGGTSDSERARRLIREAQAMAQLSHENLVVVYDAGAADGIVFLAMELVDGTSLRHWFADRPWREKLAAVLAAGRGLVAAHAAGIIHRDFKPENVLVDRAGRVKVADFGLARADAAPMPAPGVTPAMAAGDVTRTGSVLGTPAYMAPEIFAGKLADARSDQFALAVVAWEAVWGERPFRGEYLALSEAIAEGRITSGPRPPGVPARLDVVLRRAMAVDPAARYPDVAALLAAIESALVPPRRWPLAVVIALALAAGGAVIAWRAGVFAGPELPPPPLDAISIETHPRATDAYDGVVRAHAGELAKCSVSLARGTRGAVELEFEVGPDGHVVQVRIVRDPFPNTAVARCAASSAMGWDFPPNTPATIVVPLNFENR